MFNIKQNTLEYALLSLIAIWLHKLGNKFFVYEFLHAITYIKIILNKKKHKMFVWLVTEKPVKYKSAQIRIVSYRHINTTRFLASILF